MNSVDKNYYINSAPTHTHTQKNRAVCTGREQKEKMSARRHVQSEKPHHGLGLQIKEG